MGLSLLPVRFGQLWVHAIAAVLFLGIASVSYASTVRFRLDVSRCGWQATGVRLRQSEEVVVRASGVVSYANGGRSNPDGCLQQAVDPCGARYLQESRYAVPVQGAWCASLVGRIGDGSGFLVGSERKIKARESGELMLAFNDHACGDNEGVFDVVIESVSSPGDSKKEPPKVSRQRVRAVKHQRGTDEVLWTGAWDPRSASLSIENVEGSALVRHDGDLDSFTIQVRLGRGSDLLLRDDGMIRVGDRLTLKVRCPIGPAGRNYQVVRMAVHPIRGQVLASEARFNVTVLDDQGSEVAGTTVKSSHATEWTRRLGEWWGSEVSAPTFVLSVAGLGSDWRGSGDSVAAADALQLELQFLGPMGRARVALHSAVEWGKLLFLVSSIPH